MQTYGYQHNSSLYSEYFPLDLSLKVKRTGIQSPSLCTCSGVATCVLACPLFHLPDSTAHITEKAPLSLEIQINETEWSSFPHPLSLLHISFQSYRSRECLNLDIPRFPGLGMETCWQDKCMEKITGEVMMIFREVQSSGTIFHWSTYPSDLSINTWANSKMCIWKSIFSAPSSILI